MPCTRVAGVLKVFGGTAIPIIGTKVPTMNRGVQGVKVERNERAREEVPAQPLAKISEAAMRFVTQEAGFAQVYTVNREGFPVGRTMVAVLNPDWSVSLVQRKVHKRIGQLQRNPNVEILWLGDPSPDSVNDRPHVYDWGLAIPRAVFLRGRARFMSDDELVETFTTQTAIQRAKGLTKAPERDRWNILEELAGIVVDPVQVRAEGFGTGAESFTWRAGEL